MDMRMEYYLANSQANKLRLNNRVVIPIEGDGQLTNFFTLKSSNDRTQKSIHS